MRLGLFQLIQWHVELGCRSGGGKGDKTHNQTTRNTCFVALCCGLEGCEPLLVPPQEEELFACQRGCRLFSICQFVDDGADLNRTKQECDSGEPSEPHQPPSS